MKNIKNAEKRNDDKELMKQLKQMVKSRYGNVKKFAEASGLPRTTVQTFLQRGINSARFETVRIVCRTLGISIDSLIDGDIEMAGNVDRYGPELGAWLARVSLILETGKATIDGEKVDRSKAQDILCVLEAAKKMTEAK